MNPPVHHPARPAHVCTSCGRVFAASGHCPHDGAALSAADDARVGTRVGRHVLVRRLSRGGMGTVYVAVHEAIGSRVAVKVLHRPADEDSADWARFLREAQAVNRIQHPHIVPILDIDRLPDGHPYVVMELLDGAPLSERLTGPGRATVGEVARWLDQVLGALEAVHGAGYVHRDLKPENVFVTTGGDARLLDFGVAKLLDDGAYTALTQEGHLVGTPIYLSPEQAAGPGAPLGPASDVYSFGVMLYEVFTGRSPFPNKNVAQLLVAHLTATPPRPSAVHHAVTPELDALILACLEKAPERRPASAAEVRRRLAAALEGYAAAGPEGEGARLPEAAWTWRPAPRQPRDGDGGRVGVGAGAGPAAGPGSGAGAAPDAGSGAGGPVGSGAVAARGGDPAAGAGGPPAWPATDAVGSGSGAVAAPGWGPAPNPAPRPVRPGRAMLAWMAVVALAGTGAGATLLRGPGGSGQANAVEAAPAARPEPATAAVGQAIVVALPGKPTTLDPALAKTTDTIRALHHVVEPLVRVDPITLEPVPCLATAWRRDGEGWRFTLREGVRFHDGRLLDAATAVAAIEHTLVARGVVTDAVAVGPREVAVRTPIGPGVFLTVLASTVHSLALPTPREGDVVGTGPYRIERSNRHLGAYVLDAFGDYWGAPPRAPRIVFRSAPDEDVRLGMVRSGDAHVAMDLLPGTAERVRREGRLEVAQTPESTVVYLALDVTHPLLRNPSVRHAVSAAIDTGRLAREVFHGSRAGGLAPPAVGGRTSASLWRHDPEAARGTLLAGGLDGTTLDVLVISEESSRNPDPQRTAALLAEDLRAVGLEIEPTFLSRSDLASVRERDARPAMFLTNWAPDYADPSTFYSPFADGGHSASFFREEAFDALFLEARRETDEAARRTLFEELEAYLDRVRPIVPIAHVPAYHAVRPELSGARFGYDLMVDLTDAALAAE